mgnify:CR=1 FL=1
MKKKIIIGSRGSKLALLYAQQAKDKIIENTDLGNEDILIKSITTKGDEVQDIRSVSYTHLTLPTICSV